MEKIPISGSNFKIMKPSPGVKIKEHNNVKAGDINYFETFHKFSLEEFNKVLKNTLSLEKEKLRGILLNYVDADEDVMDKIMEQIYIYLLKNTRHKGNLAFAKILIDGME